MDFTDYLFGFNNSVKSKVDTCINYFEEHDISSLQNALYNLYIEFNQPGGGRKIISFKEKDRLCECFDMMLKYDWIHDSDIREVWAEDGFYCIVTYLNEDAKNQQDYFAGGLDLFLLLNDGGKELYPKFRSILNKAKLRAIMIGSEEADIFTQEDFEGGVPYILRQFNFFAAALISGVERVHPEIISDPLRPAYERAKSDYEFAAIPADVMLKKLNFFAKIIGSILAEM